MRLMVFLLLTCVNLAASSPSKGCMLCSNVLVERHPNEARVELEKVVDGTGCFVQNLKCLGNDIKSETFVQMTSIYDEMQNITVHHLLHNKIMLNNKIAMSYLAKNGCYFPMMKKLLQSSTDVDDLLDGIEFDDIEEVEINEDRLERFHEKICRLQNLLEYSENNSNEKLVAICANVDNLIDLINKKLENLRSICQKLQLRFTTLAEQVNALEEIIRSVQKL